ncbi:cellulose synthase/poly-beta-1,6-N-acetylglucosamine synthase-like glycosyltransferase [Sagittula marina]|uniref:Cellulose synthase/poly-beta-1,6-N-acetylglucosamine synthase-like glycosyltransferase n=1 Tax=Sagittula marina TaxID=943940 RepID=A0A7W6GS69_9RHOB|nr:glycosyltransferase family 2 protein [Sagittula marina]MBB3985625.1 cellulose synthase/poly-beta-1,6-N-acetylglucosamine synthase-like glycosyltransferase [Sagittula marina]
MTHPVHPLPYTLLAQAGDPRGQPVSRILLDNHTSTPRVMLGAMAEAARIGQPIARVMTAEALATRQQVLEAQARHYGALIMDKTTTPADGTLAGLLPGDFCLLHGVLPWVRLGETLVLATSRPDEFDAMLADLPPDLGPVMMALALEADIHDEIGRRHGDALAKAAENWVPAEDSCRDLNKAGPLASGIALVAIIVALGLLATVPQLFFGAALIMALGSLLVSQILKVSALIAAPRREPAPLVHLPRTPPVVTIIVPLFHEQEIASTLIKRLSRLTYPKALLDVVLVLEAEDAVTCQTLNRTTLPPWMRRITVPPGEIQTKPRALNYALRFTRGEIVGIYDAEDAPAPDQIEHVVSHFSKASHDVGCVQGILDYYNPRANWLSRCFTIEYASWFRIVLPGLARMGFAVPLGGTTVFFRREALEKVRGWDAHNVTEDADLGMRLARHGWQTELIRSVTREEANNRFWPWIKQRSRWLKGYGITWWVHSRRPKRLWQDLGAKRFFGLQALLLGTLLQFALAPVLWSFWLIVVGLPHPMDGYMAREGILALTGLFLAAEAISFVIGIAALARSPHAQLYHWVPTMFAYFPMGTAAVYKALWETAFSPFYWDKTQHGHSDPDHQGADIPPDTHV